MTRHQKRLAVPKSWPVERKEQVYTVKADAGPHGEDGVPLLIVLRDVLGYVDSKKEARYALGQDSVLVNGTPVNDEQRPIGMFDIIAFTEREEYYRVFPDEGGRLALTPIDADAAESKLGKVVGKTQVADGRYQLALHDGQTLVVDDDAYSANDSVVVSNDDGDIVVHFPYEEGALVTAVRGQHAGEIGTLDEIQVTPGSSPNNVWVTQDDGDGFETVEEYVVVIDENFTGDEGDQPADATAETEVEANADEVVEEDSEAAEADSETEDEAEAESEVDKEEGAETEADETDAENEAEAESGTDEAEAEGDEQ